MDSPEEKNNLSVCDFFFHFVEVMAITRWRSAGSPPTRWSEDLRSSRGNTMGANGTGPVGLEKPGRTCVQ